MLIFDQLQSKIHRLVVAMKLFQLVGFFFCLLKHHTVNTISFSLHVDEV